MMSVEELFFGEAESVWIINTTAFQVIRQHAQPIPDQYTSEQRNFPQPMTTQHINFQQLASPCDPPSQMGHQYHQLRQSPPRQSLQHQALEHQHNNIPQKNLSQQLTDQDHQYHEHNQKGQQRQQGPLQQISQQHHHQYNQNGPPHNSPYLGAHQPSAPPINAHLYSNQQENFGHYASPETKVVRMKVPMCCEACEDRVKVSLSAMRGVQSVQCDIRKEKVTVIGSATPADILKACKKLFKRSEMWVDRFY